MPNPIMASSEMVDVLSEVVSGGSYASRGAAFGERGDNARSNHAQFGDGRRPLRGRLWRKLRFSGRRVRRTRRQCPIRSWPSSEMVDVLSEVVSGGSYASRGAAFGERGDNARSNHAQFGDGRRPLRGRLWRKLRFSGRRVRRTRRQCPIRSWPVRRW